MYPYLLQFLQWFAGKLSGAAGLKEAKTVKFPSCACAMGTGRYPSITMRALQQKSVKKPEQAGKNGIVREKHNNTDSLTKLIY